MANYILAGYEQKVNAKIEDIIDHAGPASYANVASSAGAGDVLSALDLGRGGIEFVTPVAIAASGNYAIQAFPTAKNGTVAKTVSLRWFTVVNGIITAEVTNATDLSAEQVRLLVRVV